MLALTLWCACILAVSIGGLQAQCLHGKPTVKLTPGPDRGILEVKENGSLGTVCDSYFTNKAATVVCKSLGQPGHNAYRVHVTPFLPAISGSTPESVITRAKCSGSESSLCACNVTYENKTCTESSLVGVVCTNASVSPTWYYKGQWLGSDVKTVSLTEGDDISCAAINDTARYFTTRISVPGQTKSLSSGTGRQTVKDIQKQQSGALVCSISNWQFKDQANSTIQLVVLGSGTGSATALMSIISVGQLFIVSVTMQSLFLYECTSY